MDWLILITITYIAFYIMNPQFHLFKKQITNPFNYALFMLSKLPMGFVSGLKIISLSQQEAAVSVRFKWINQNPFKSIYFAVLSMAAELSTGVLAFAQIYKRKPGVSMLVVKLEAEFYKKAVGKITFTCNDGDKIEAAIEQSINENIGTIVQCTSIGKNIEGEDVARFIFTWSFKAKK
ncbi:MAG: thioesterase [Chitinophagaceae bacterium]